MGMTYATCTIATVVINKTKDGISRYLTHASPCLIHDLMKRLHHSVFDTIIIGLGAGNQFYKQVSDNLSSAFTQTYLQQGDPRGV